MRRQSKAGEEGAMEIRSKLLSMEIRIFRNTLY